MSTFDEYFRIATWSAPYPYQRRLAERHADSLLVETGCGKTEAVVLAWDWRRRTGDEPRRLIYALPMRSLVEQTKTRLEGCFERLRAAGYDDVPRIDVVMGGDVGEDWFQKPEEPWVVIGTQDMLLSRALNRGYAMNRFFWPMTFGAINNDAYWVVDEVQLHGIGAVTAGQLQAFRERFGTSFPSKLTLMSATLDESWFETADFTLKDRVKLSLDDADYQSERVRAIVSAEKTLERCDVYEPQDVARLAVERHRPGTLTLVVLNTVERAQEVYRRLARADMAAERTLLHSRYRPLDRAKHTLSLGERPDADGPGRIVVATQVVEAGIDVSAAILITDIAPWSSLVQRFGRCNRKGIERDARCLWLDAGELNEKKSLPYDVEDIQSARETLLSLEKRSVAPADLPSNPIPLRDGLVLRKPDLFDLFDTSPDLAGHDTDVSPYIRPGNDLSVSLFWRDEPPRADDPPQRLELCPATLSGLRDLVRTARAAGHGRSVRVANQFSASDDDAWVTMDESQIRPGVIVWLKSDLGWYDPVLGFTKVARRVEPVEREALRGPHECVTHDGDVGSATGVAVTLTKHSLDTRDEAQMLAQVLRLNGVAETVVEAALWHDVGKVHSVFQETMREGNKGLAHDVPWAKSISYRKGHKRKGFRHELPSALAYLASRDDEPQADLVAYLIAAHHGKLRLSAQPKRYEADEGVPQLLGNRDGEELASVDLGDVHSPKITISLDAFRVGANQATRAWTERTTALRDDPELGPFRLAYLELLVRVADWRASAKEAKEATQ